MEIQPEGQSESRNSAPGIGIALNIVGTLDILGGVILFFSFLPGHANPGYTWGTYAYVASITALFGGIVSGLLMFAAASALTYLHEIHEVSAMLLGVVTRVFSSTRGGNLETASQPSADSGSLDSERNVNTLWETLHQMIERVDSVDWVSHKCTFCEVKPLPPTLASIPTKPVRPPSTPEPNPKDEEYQAQATFRDLWNVKGWRKKQAEARGKYDKAQAAWRANQTAIQAFDDKPSEWKLQVQEAEAFNAKAQENYVSQMRDWENQIREFSLSEEQRIEVLKHAYETGEELGVHALLEAALQPERFPEELNLHFYVAYEELDKRLQVDVQVASAEALGLASFGSEQYKSVICELGLAVIHQVVEADTARVIHSIQVVIRSSYTSPATGLETEVTLINVEAMSAALLKLNLLKVDAEDCFRALGANVHFANDQEG